MIIFFWLVLLWIIVLQVLGFLFIYRIFRTYFLSFRNSCCAICIVSHICRTLWLLLFAIVLQVSKLFWFGVSLFLCFLSVHLVPVAFNVWLHRERGKRWGENGIQLTHHKPDTSYWVSRIFNGCMGWYRRGRWNVPPPPSPRKGSSIYPLLKKVFLNRWSFLEPSVM